MNENTEQDMESIVLDTETTGLVQPQLIELAYKGINLQLKDNAIQATTSTTKSFEERYNPGTPSTYGALCTHNIPDSELVDCTPSHMAEIPKETKYIIGHNIDYDAEVLGLMNDPVKRICTKALSSSLFPGIDSHRQGAMMYYFYGDEAKDYIVNAHSALPDVAMCCMVLNALLKSDEFNVMLWKEIGKGDIQMSSPIELLWQISEKCRIPKVMPFGKHKGDPISKLPTPYVNWLLKQNIDPYLKQAVVAVDGSR